MKFLDWLQLALIVLKFTGHIQAGWLAVFSPYIFVCFAALLLAVLEKWKEKLQDEKRSIDS